MRRYLLSFAFLIVLAVCSAAWARSAWVMPQRNYAFDFEINYTGARLLSLGQDDRPLYDRALLAAEARHYSTYAALYSKLYLTYIQTPITASITLPFSRLPYEDARLAFLGVSNLLLLAAAAIMIHALRPSRLLILAAFLIFATYEAMFDSLRLGQVDAVIVLCLAAAFWLIRRGPAPVAGVPLALAAMLKLSPVLVIGYFAWRRSWGLVLVAAASMVLLAGLSVAVAGWDNNLTFVRDTMPRLMKSSTFYDNISIPGAVARAHFGRDSWYYEDEVPDWPLALRVTTLLFDGLLVLAAYVITRRDTEAGFMLAITVAVLISPVSWSFYPTWLVPALLWLVRRYEDRRAWVRLALLLLVYPALAIVPAHFQEVSVELYAWPLKTLSVAALAALVAWEGWTTAARSTVPAPLPPRVISGAETAG